MADTIFGFETGAGGDILNLTDILQGYDALSDLISNFVQINENGDNVEIQINADGSAGGRQTAMPVPTVVTSISFCLLLHRPPEIGTKTGF